MYQRHISLCTDLSFSQRCLLSQFASTSVGLLIFHVETFQLNINFIQEKKKNLFAHD